MGQSSFYSVNDRRLHFGLGESTRADLEVHWTNGLVERFPGIEHNQLVTIKEGQGLVKSLLQGVKRPSKQDPSEYSKMNGRRGIEAGRPRNTDIQVRKRAYRQAATYEDHRLTLPGRSSRR